MQWQPQTERERERERERGREGVERRLRRLEEASITSRRQTMAKNEPESLLNRPQDTERYNAKDSIVTRTVKCSCLVSETKWATLSVSFHRAAF